MEHDSPRRVDCRGQPSGCWVCEWQIGQSTEGGQALLLGGAVCEGGLAADSLRIADASVLLLRRPGRAGLGGSDGLLFL